MKQLRHFSIKPVTDVRSVAQERGPSFKPIGLWISAEGNGDGWSDWCRSEEFALERLAYEHDVALSPKANILQLSSAADIDDFSREFAEPIGSFSLSYIDWGRVSDEWQGILIAPYIWSRRLDGPENTRWYYSWDCASGCIWDADAIESISANSVVVAA